MKSVVQSKVEETKTYDSKLRTAYEDNDALNRKIQELANANRKISEYDNKITVLSQEIERLNNILKIKLDEIHNLE
jgi:uncharacterized small protein (DUF1192 family)